MNIRSISSTVATDGATVERTKPGRAEHGQGHRVSGSTDSFQGDFKSLLNAVQSGDLTSAQSSVESLKGKVNGASATYSPSSTAPEASTSTTSTATEGSTSTTSTVGADLKAMFDAVQAGDVEGAQAALKLFVSDARADGPHGGPSKANYGNSGLKISQAIHRHHHRLGLESIIRSLFANATSDASPASPTPPPTTDETPVDSSTSPTTEPQTTEEAPEALTTPPVTVVVDPAVTPELTIQTS